MEEELKMCPFGSCRNNDIEIVCERVSFSNYKYFAYCDNCGTCGPREDSKQEAIDAWNKRS